MKEGMYRSRGAKSSPKVLLSEQSEQRVNKVRMSFSLLQRRAAL
jgi:hypothetical protein